VQQGETSSLKAVGRRLAEPVIYWLDNIGSVVSLTLRTLLWLVRRPFRLGRVIDEMDFIGVQSIFIVALTGTFSGMVLALQMSHALRSFNAEGRVGGVVAVSLARELAPVFTAIMVTARGGSAMAAELGNMRVTEQIDALTTMGVSAVQYLLSPRLLAAVLMMPLLYALYGALGLVGAYVVAVNWMGGDPGLFVQSIRDFTTTKDIWMGLIKSTVFGFFVAAISCRHGFFASGGARGVGQATTRAVVESCVTVLIVNYFVTQALLNAGW
jgi:phospholipid/cholesterol/gamma-HCH transport system permease protein